MEKERVGLGDKVQDLISKSTGIAIAKTIWLNGCVRWLVQLEGLQEGKTIEFSVDDIQLKVLKKGVVAAFGAIPISPVRPRTGGGGRPEPTRASITR